MTITPIAGLVAFVGVAAIGANRHWNGNTEWINLGWTAVAAVGALGCCGILAKGIFGMTKSNGFANFCFAFFMVLASAGVVLFKGPAHDFAIAKLTTIWPQGAEFLAKTDPNAKAAPKADAAMNSKTAVKGEPAIRVYRKGDQSVQAQPKGD